MLTKIREKAQGIFAWVILIMICVPFALWGIQNYIDVGKETPVASVGEKDFFQRDVNRAYQQYSQQMARLNLPEETLKKQALDKLIRDEVLLQYVQDKGLTVTDVTARDFIKGLDYFQKDGKFDKNQYNLLLSSQGMSSAQFVHRIRNAIMMEQFQRSIMDSGFATESDIQSFYKIQNQQRDVAYITVPLTKVTEQPDAAAINEYYEQNQLAYQTEEQMAVEYVELSLQSLADLIDASEEQLLEFYEQQKDLYTTKERRKISHILFKFNKDEAHEVALEKATGAKARLATEDFAKVAEAVSDDKLTAKKGGDLGLFTVGVMEPAFEEAATGLAMGEVSEPIKSSFGYHLIKVTDLVPETVKPYAEVKAEIASAYKKSEAEAEFDELAELLAEVSFENPDSLAAVADAIGVEPKKTGLFTRVKGDGVANIQAVRDAAFTEDVMNGNNSEPVEINSERLLVLRMLEYSPATVKPLVEVQPEVIEAIMANEAKEKTLQRAQELKAKLQEGNTLEQVAKTADLELQKLPQLTRNNGDIPWQLSQAIFKAPKPASSDAPSHFVVTLPENKQAVVSLYAVKEGQLTDDKKQLQLAKVNIAKALGQADFFAVIESLQADKDIIINNPEE